MSKARSRLLLFGLDGLMLGLINKFSEEGEVPCIAKLMQKGSTLELLPCPPCDTPTNWTTIVTGAWTGTHGATGFNVHLPGESLSQGVACSFDTRLCQAEYLWDVLEREGSKCLIYDYPPSQPPTLRRGLVIGGWLNPDRVGQGAVSVHTPEFKEIPPYPQELEERTEMVATEVPAPKGVRAPAEEVIKKSKCTCEQFLRALDYLKQEYEWDALFCHLHLPDILTHRILNFLWEAHPLYQPELAKKYWSLMKQAYNLLDETLEEAIQRFADENTLICIISDHGGLPSSKLVWPGYALQKAGLIKFVESDGRNDYKVDLTHSQAAFYFSPPDYIWVNLKGREPGGIVEPGTEYEKVCDRIVEALVNIRDPDNGKCPFSLVIRKDQADFLGQWGDRCGDVVCFVEPEYTLVDFGVFIHRIVSNVKDLLEMGDIGSLSESARGAHHGHLPSHRIPPFSVSGVAVIVAPGVKQRYLIERPTSMINVAPTLSYLLKIPAPAQNEGGVLESILQ